MRQVFSDLNLNGQAPARVQPNLGEWGPNRVPTTKSKKRARVLVVVGYLAVVAALFVAGGYFYQALMGG